MARLQLRIYIEPGAAEIFFNILRRDGNYERLSAVIDTGAAVTLLPDDLLETVNYRPGDRGTITIEQAGIAKQAFQAVEHYVYVDLEDQFGQRTGVFEIPVWFTKTSKALVGFAGILDQAILQIDMLQRTGWLDITPEPSSMAS
jgi:hypothetical protein